MSETTDKHRTPMLRCSSCGRKCAGQVLSTGCLSAKCRRCFADPAAAAAATHVPAPRKRGPKKPLRSQKTKRKSS